MPELPDIVVYVDQLRARLLGRALQNIRISSPFLVRTYAPPIEEAYGKQVLEISRAGKRLVFELEEQVFLILHLMIAGRLHWRPAGARIAGNIGLAAFDFPNGTLVLTEAGTRKRAALHVVRGRDNLARHSHGGLEILEADLSSFRGALLRENHTLKRALTDPRLFSGIGNAYSDEILHAARLSPLKRTEQLREEEIARLYEASRSTLLEWISRLRTEAGSAFPENVSAFRSEMAVHGRHKLPCPRCGSPIQRIVYAENETNYCASCQTDGKLLADRALSRLLRTDWPRNLEELEDLYKERSK